MNRDYQKVLEIAKKIKQVGGTCYFVGGYVRDTLQGISSNDYDIEVHKITPEKLREILNTCGEVITIGSSFGIFNLKGYDIDIAMPRKERLIGPRHKDFDVEVDPFIGTYNASKRRDFTINALMKDVLTGEIIDHFNGLNDLKKKVIRHVNDESFCEDPLRVLRCASFAARFDKFTIDKKTIELCRKISLKDLSKERIFEELKKALLKAKNKPSIFFESLRKMNHLSYWFKEIEDLIKIEQNLTYHPEGNVWNHTMNVLDSGAFFLNKIEEKNKLPFMLSCLCHDLGKVPCTTINEKGDIHAIGHEIEGVNIARMFLSKITNDKDLINYVLNMVRLHMMPNAYAKDNSRIKSTNKLFDRSICPKDLICLSMADVKGSMCEDYEKNLPFLWDRLNRYHQMMEKPYVKGEDLVKLGFKPSPKFKDALDYAHDLRLKCFNYDKQLELTIKYLKELEGNKE